MKHRYLAVTFRKGMRVDFDASGTPIGIEITAPGAVTVADIDAILVQHGVAQLADHELGPLAA